MKKYSGSLAKLAKCTLLSLTFVLASCSSDNPPASSGSNSSGGDSHVCESKCPICGLCTDMECLEEVCLTKCGDNFSFGPTFTAAQELNVAKASMQYDKTKGYYTGFNKANEAAYSYAINASSKETVNLTAYAYKTSAEDVFTSVVTTKINGEQLDRPTVIHSGETTDIATINLGCITLEEGENVIDFIANSNDEHAHEMTAITIAYENEESSFELLPATQVAHTCKELCPTCGGCLDFSCLNPGCANKCNCDSKTKNATIFTVLDERADNNGRGINAEIDGVGCSWGKETRIDYKINSDIEGTVKFGAVVSSDSAEDRLFTDQFVVTLNGETVKGEGKMPVSATGKREWSDYQMVVVGEISLKKGKNTVVFSQTPISGKTPAYNFQSMIIFSDEGNFTWYVPGPDDHVLQLVNEKAATCVSEGNKEYYACSHCDKIFSDKDGVQEITDKSSVIIPINPDNHLNTKLGDDEISLTCLDCNKFVMYTFSAMDDRCTVTGVNKNNDEGCIPGTNKVVSNITYFVQSDKDVTLPMYVNCSAIATHWEIEFNKTWGVEIASEGEEPTSYTSTTIHHNFDSLPSYLKDTITSRYNYYVYEYVCDVTLKAGVNKVEFKGTGKEQLNFRNLGFKNPGEAKLSWAATTF